VKDSGLVGSIAGVLEGRYSVEVKRTVFDIELEFI
jgi:hypothetical protein